RHHRRARRAAEGRRHTGAGKGKGQPSPRQVAGRTARYQTLADRARCRRNVPPQEIPDHRHRPRHTRAAFGDFLPPFARGGGGGGWKFFIGFRSEETRVSPGGLTSAVRQTTGGSSTASW